MYKELFNSFNFFRLEKNMKDIVFLIVGASGSGKTTVVEKMCEMYNLKSVQSYTDRPKRTENETGHIFVSKEEFDKIQDICAYTIYNGYRYCATSEQINNCDLYIIDPNGIDYFKKHYAGNKDYRLINICVPETIRLERMLNRNDNPVKATERINTDRIEFKDVENKVDILIPNINIDNCIKQIKHYIDNYKLYDLDKIKSSK